MALPILENKRIGPLGIVLVDAENAKPRAYADADRILRRILANRLLGAIRPKVRLCGPESLDFPIGNFTGFANRNPGATWEDFLTEGRPDRIVEDDSAPDPRLDSKQILVREVGGDGEVLGLFVLYNVVIEQDRTRQLVISSMVMPGCRAAHGFTLRETWSRIMRRILEDDWPMEDGRVLDTIEWRFPTRPGHRWKLKPEELVHDGEDEGCGVCDRIVTDLSDHDRTDEEGVPKKIRRRAVVEATAPRGARSP